MATLKVCTAEDVRAEVELKSDTEIEDKITQATDWLETDYLMRRLLRQTYTNEYHDGDNTDKLFVYNPPAVSVTSIETWTGSGWYSLDLTYLVTEYSDQASNLEAGGMVHLRTYSFPKGVRNVRITYTGGIATTTSGLPTSLRRGGALVTAAMINTGKRGGSGIDTRTIAATGETVVFSDEFLTQEARMCLAKWRRLESRGFF